jgi:hypothetical protein
MPECDLLLIAGDICPMGDHSVAAQHLWLRDKFARFLDRVPAKHVVGIAGNHDVIFAQPLDAEPQVPYLPWSYLQDSGIELCGLKLWGSPWAPWLAAGWVFQGPKRDPNEAFLRERFSLIPADTDILVTHSPPYGILDLTVGGATTPAYPSERVADRHAGSKALAVALQRLRPRLRLHICGHLHDARGVTRDGSDGPLIANASALTAWYDPMAGPPWFIFDVPLDGGPAVQVAAD